MNRAARRREESEERREQRRRQRWFQDVNHFAGAAQGAVQVFIIHTADWGLLIDVAETGEPTAMAVAQSISTWKEKAVQVEGVPGHVFLCLNCIQEFGPATATPAAFAIAMPFADYSCALAFAICKGCAACGEDLQKMVLHHLKKIWPDVHYVHGGRA
jgi:hypothetical protein